MEHKFKLGQIWNSSHRNHYYILAETNSFEPSTHKYNFRTLEEFEQYNFLSFKEFPTLNDLLVSEIFVKEEE